MASKYADELKFIFIVSQVDLVDDLEGTVYVSESLPGVKILTERHPGQKCERCWHYFDADSNSGEGSICPRCQEYLQVAGD